MPFSTNISEQAEILQSLLCNNLSEPGAKKLYDRLCAMESDGTTHDLAALQEVLVADVYRDHLKQFLKSNGLKEHEGRTFFDFFDFALPPSDLHSVKDEIFNHLKNINNAHILIKSLLSILKPYSSTSWFGRDETTKLYNYLNAIITKVKHQDLEKIYEELPSEIATAIVNFVMAHGNKVVNGKKIRTHFDELLPDDGTPTQKSIDDRLFEVENCHIVINVLLSILAPYQTPPLRDSNAIELYTHLNKVINGPHRDLAEVYAALPIKTSKAVIAFVMAHGNKVVDGKKIRTHFDELLPEDGSKEDLAIKNHLEIAAQCQKVKDLLNHYQSKPEYKILYSAFEQVESKNSGNPSALLEQFKAKLDDKNDMSLAKAMNELLENYGSEVDLKTNETIVEKLVVVLSKARQLELISKITDLLVPYTKADEKYNAFADKMLAQLKQFHSDGLLLSEIALKFEKEFQDNVARNTAYHFFATYVYKDEALVKALLPLLPKNLKKEVCYLLNLKKEHGNGNKVKAIQEDKDREKEKEFHFLPQLNQSQKWLTSRRIIQVKGFEEYRPVLKLQALEDHWKHYAIGTNYDSDIKSLLDGKPINYKGAPRYGAPVPGLSKEQIRANIIQYEEKRLEDALISDTSIDAQKFAAMKNEINNELKKILLNLQIVLNREVKRSNEDEKNAASVSEIGTAYSAAKDAIKELEKNQEKSTLYKVTNFAEVFKLAKKQLKDARNPAREYCDRRASTIWKGKEHQAKMEALEKLFIPAINALSRGFDEKLNQEEKRYQELQNAIKAHYKQALSENAEHKAELLRLIEKHQRGDAISPDKLKSLATQYISQGMVPIKQFFRERSEQARHAIAVGLGEAAPTPEAARSMQIDTYNQIKAVKDGQSKLGKEASGADVDSALAQDKLVLRTSFRRDRDWIEKRGNTHVSITKSTDPEHVAKWFLRSVNLLKLNGEQLVFSLPPKVQYIVMGIMAAHGVPQTSIEGIKGTFRILPLGVDNLKPETTNILFQKGIKAYEDYIAKEINKVIENSPGKKGHGVAEFTKTDAMQHIDPKAVAAFRTPGLGG